MIINWHYYKGHAGWIKIFNWYVQWKHNEKCPMLFSERNGYIKYYKLGKYRYAFFHDRKL